MGRSDESLHGLHPDRRVDDALSIHHTTMVDKQSVIHPTRLIPPPMHPGAQRHRPFPSTRT